VNVVGQLITVAAVVLTGCATAPNSNLTADYPQEQAEVRNRLNEIFDAAAKKDFERLEGYHLYGPKFTKFATEAPARQDAAAARKGERDGLSAIRDLSMRANDLKIDVFGNVAIATFVISSSFHAGTDTFERQARSTMVLVKDQGAWKITHEHFSPLKTNP
jgi:ketosteroid isomerase-like protein